MRQLFSSIPGQVLDFILVAIGLVLIFKDRITELVTNIFGKITSQAGKI